MSLRSLHIFIFGLGFCCCAVAQSKRVGQQGGSVIALETEVYSMSTAALLPYRAVVNDQIRNEYYRHLPALQQGLALTYRYRWQGVALGLQLGHQDWGRQELLFPKFQELRFSNGRVFPVPSDRARTDIHLAMLSTGLFVQHNFAWGQRVALGYRLGYAGWWLYRRRVATIYTGAL